jgi:hypothetical protein
LDVETALRRIAKSDDCRQAHLSLCGLDPNLVDRNNKGEVESVRYDAVNAMLLNEFLKAHRQMEEQDKRIERLTAQLKEQAAQIRKVSAPLEASKPAPQVG